MARMRAPNGVTSFSIEGVTMKTDADGMVDVDDNAAKVLSSHGFEFASEPPKLDEEIRVTRQHIVDAMEAMGVAVSHTEMRAEKLVAAFTAACEAKIASFKSEVKAASDAKAVPPPPAPTTVQKGGMPRPSPSQPFPKG